MEILGWHRKVYYCLIDCVDQSEANVFITRIKSISNFSGPLPLFCFILPYYFETYFVFIEHFAVTITTLVYQII